MESTPRSPQQNSTRALGSSLKLPALELRRSSCNREGSNSGQTSEMEPQASDKLARKIQLFREVLKSSDIQRLMWDVTRREEKRDIVRRIVFEQASKVIQELDRGSEERRKLPEVVDRLLSQLTSEPEKVDRTQDLQVIQHFYGRYRETFHIDRVKGRMGSCDQLPDRNRKFFGSHEWTEVFGFADILKEIIDALSKEAAVSGLPGMDEERTMKVNMVVQPVGTSSLFKLLKYFLRLQHEHDECLNYFINNIVKELQADPTANDFGAIQVWWAVMTWSHYFLTSQHMLKGLQKVGTVLHWAIELQDVKMVTQILEAKNTDVNAVNWMKGTPLHMAVLKGNIEIVRELLKCKETIRLTEEDEAGRTPIEIAHAMGHTGIERILMEERTVNLYVEELHKNRQMYVDAANAILVGAALIASVTFASWLQPPMGYTLPSGHVDVEENGGLQVFWVFNALSFYFAIGTVIFGARGMLPEQHVFIRRNTELLRQNLMVIYILLACSISFVIVAFEIAGSIVLTPILKVQWTMIAPTIIGGLVCVISLGLLFNNIWNVSFGTRTGIPRQYLLPKEVARGLNKTI